MALDGVPDAEDLLHQALADIKQPALQTVLHLDTRFNGRERSGVTWR